MSTNDSKSARRLASPQEAAAKLTALKTADYFAERSKDGDPAAFDRFITRQGGQPPALEDRWDPTG